MTFKRAARFVCAIELLLVLLVQSAQGASVEDRFTEANRFYEQGDYASAIELYEGILQEGVGSAGVAFNLGNAHFKGGHLGKAIVAYRQALDLDPRDPDIQANLQFARDRVSGASSVRRAGWVRAATRLSFGEWMGVLVGLTWVVFGLLSVAAWRPGWRGRLKPWIWGSATGLADVAVVLLLVVRTVKGAPLAVVLQDGVDVRYGPVEESRRFYVVSEGTELLALGKQGDWVQVEDAAQRRGWVPRGAVWVPAGQPSH